MKKILLLTLMLLLMSWGINAQTATPPTNGDGTEATPYQIATLNNLIWIAKNPGTWDKYFIQTEDIDASSTPGGWVPISNSFENYFSGNYDGNGKTISHLIIYNNSSYDGIGLFGVAIGATIQNLGIIDIYFWNIQGITGGLVGYAEGVTINNCYSTGVIKADETGSLYSGGLVGSLNVNSTMVNCYSSCNVNGGSTVGGLVGYNYSSTISASRYLNGAVTGYSAQFSITGGLVAYNAGSISECYATKTAVAGYDYTGGLVGENGTGGSISNCYSRCTCSNNDVFGAHGGGLVGVNLGSISNCYSPGILLSNMGGLVGINNGTILYSFWNTDVAESGATWSNGGTGTNTTALKTISTYTDASWDFTNIWGISSCYNDGYPYILMEYDAPTAPTGLDQQAFYSSTGPTVADLMATGENIQWYSVSSGGTPLASTVALVDDTHYYASQTIGECESTTRLDVLVSLSTISETVLKTSGTFIVPDNIYQIKVQIWGGGGKGASSFSVNDHLSGGGGGAYSGSTLNVTPGSSYPVNVGPGSTDNFVNGGDSWFGSSTTVMAKGGNSCSPNSTVGAKGGSAASGYGDIKYSGGNGADGIWSSPTIYSGGGGSSAGTDTDGTSATNYQGAIAPSGGGNGGNGINQDGTSYVTGPGDPGSVPGGGGGGAFYYSTGNVYGGNGADGQAIVTWEVGCGTPSPTADAQSFCILESHLVSDLDVSGEAEATFSWYNVQTGGSPLAGSTELTTGTYYVSQTINGCQSQRTSVSVSVNPVLPVSVSIASDDDDNLICAGEEITFTATPTNAGASPSYQWYINSSPVDGQTSATYTYTPLNGEIVYATLTSTEICITETQVTSNSITMTVSSPPDAGDISGVSKILIGGTTQLSVSGNSVAGTWESSNTAIATVDQSGNVLGEGIGTATIIYIVEGDAACVGKSDTAEFDMKVGKWVTQTFASSETFTVPADVYSVNAKAWGGGGGGAGRHPSSGYSGGGGGGGGFRGGTLGVSPGDIITITVGKGGAGGSGTDGATGGSSIISHSSGSIIAYGGTGPAIGAGWGYGGEGTFTGTVTNQSGHIGGYGATRYAPYVTGGGAGGGAGDGNNGFAGSGTTGGAGGSAGGGKGGDGSTDATPGTDGSLYGGGGGGSSNNTSSRGGNGADGKVILSMITYSCSDATLTLSSSELTDEQSVCVNSQISNISYTIGWGAIGAEVSGLPDGVSGAFNNGTFTISGTPTIAGIYNYTVTTTGTTSPCSEAEASGVITVTTPPVAGLISGNNEIKIGNTTQLLVSGNNATGTWSSEDTDIATVINGLVTGVEAGTVKILYTVAGTGGCGNDVAEFSLTVLPIYEYKFTTSTTFTVPDGVRSIDVKAWGGGGGGSGASGASGPYDGGAGGGGGGFCGGTLNVSPGDVITITVGKGGSGGVGLYSAGNNGTSSVVTHSSGTITALFGGGGQTATVGSVGGWGQDGTFTGDVANQTVYRGGNGWSAFGQNGGGAGGGAGDNSNGSYANQTSGGSGGTALGGNGGNGATGNFAGGSGSQYGGGGGGGYGNYYEHYSTGGNGANGVVIISYPWDVNCSDGTLVLSSAEGTEVQTVCEDSPITEITYTVGGGADSAKVEGLPDGVNGNFNNGVFTVSGTPTVSGIFNFTVSTTGTSMPCAEATTGGTITVNELPIVSISSQTNICEGETTALSPATGGTWSSSNDAVATVTNSGVVTGMSAGTVTFTFTDATTGCSAVTDEISISTSPNATFATMASNSPVCESEHAEFYLTGTSNAIVTYHINGETSQTITLNASGEATVDVGSAFNNQTMYLENVQNPGTECTTTLSESETVEVKPLPYANFDTPASNSPVCWGGDAYFYISATPETVITYHIEGAEGNEIVTIDATGKWQLNFLNLESNITVQLISIEYPDGKCPVGLDGNSSTIVVNQLPVVNITGNTEINSGETTTLSPVSGGTWKSNNEAVATVTDEGVVTGSGAGTATFTYNDGTTGCSATTGEVTVTETQSLVITDASGDNSECQGSDPNSNTDYIAWLANHGGSTVSEFCGGVDAISWNNNTDTAKWSDGCPNSITVTFTATDGCGNSDTTDATFTINDTQAPYIEIDASNNSTVNCVDDATVPTDLPVVMDLCSGEILPVNATPNPVYLVWNEEDDGFDEVDYAYFCKGVVKYTFNYTDGCGNPFSWIYIYNVDIPTFADIAPTEQTVECYADFNPDLFELPTVFDYCGKQITNITGPAENIPLKSAVLDICAGDITYTWTYTDCAGNQKPYVHAVHIVKTDFVENMPDDDGTVVECADKIVELVPTPPSVYDNCGTEINPSGPEISEIPECEGDVTYKWTYTDCTGRFSNVWTYTFKIDRITPPEVFSREIENGNTVECLSDAKTPWEIPYASDVCGNLLTGVITDTVDYVDGVEGIITCNGIRIYTYTYTDCSGLTNTWTYTYQIVDETPPSITVQAVNDTVECDGLGNDDEYGTWLLNHAGAEASDNCGDVNWSYAEGEWIYEQLGRSGEILSKAKHISVTFYATDDCENKSEGTTASFYIIDTTPPEIITSASDYSVQFSCEAMDDLNGWLDSHGGAVVSDDCSNIKWSHSSAVLSDGCGGTGEATVTFTARDACGNSSSTQATFKIIDTRAPRFDTSAENLTVECDGEGNTDDLNNWLVNHGGAYVLNNCGEQITWSHNYVAENPTEGQVTMSGSCGATGFVTVTFTATDECGNHSETTATFTIEDTQPPVLNDETITSASLNSSENNWCLTNADVFAAKTLESAVAALYNDDCGKVTAFNSGKTAGIDNTDCSWSFVYHFVVSDECANSTNCDVVYSGGDTMKPHLINTKVTSKSLDKLDVDECLNKAENWNATQLETNVAALYTDNCDASVSAIFIETIPGTNNSDCSWSFTYNFKVSDNCNNSDTCRVIRSGGDNTPPSIDCPVIADAYITKEGEDSYKTTGKEFDATATDNCDSDVTLTNNLTGTSTLENYEFGFGETEVIWTATDNCFHSSTCSFVVKVNKVLTETSVSVNSASLQYSDLTTFTATISPFDVTVAGTAAESVTFKVGDQEMGTAPLVNGIAILADVALLEIQPDLLSGSGEMSPGIKTVTAVFNAKDSDFDISDATTVLTINQEDAVVDYIGASIVGEADPSVNSTPVKLIASVTDINDNYRGDIRNARVRFYNGETAVSGWLTPTLVNPADLKQGIVSFDWSAPVPNAGYITYDIGIKVGTQELVETEGYYKGYETTVLNVYRTSINELITGAGHIAPVDSEGEYASDPNRKVNFGFNVKWNKTMKNLQGNFNLILRRGSEIYQIKSNALLSLGIDGADPCSHKAVFTSKANLNRITGGITENLMGNLSLQVTLTDNGESGRTDMIGITVYNGSTLIYSSSWPATGTEELNLLGGNIVVHDGTICSANDRTYTVITSDKNPSLTGDEVIFTATVYGNEDIPQGDLVFMINGEVIPGILDAKGTATVEYTFADVGLYEITADYNSTNAYRPSTGSLTQLVKGTSFILTSSKNPSVLGDEVTFTAKLSGPVTPVGTVKFFVDGMIYGEPYALTDGETSVTIPGLTVGSHTVTAVYYSTNTPEIITDPVSVIQMVNNVSVMLSSSKSTSVISEEVVFTATVNGGYSGKAVIFSIDGTPEGDPVDIDDAGNASITFGFDEAGTFAVTATLSDPVVSATLNQVVQGPALVLTSSSNPSADGKSVTFTASVTGGKEGNRIVFTIDGQSELLATLTDGFATCTKVLSEGSYLVSAAYYNDAVTEILSEASLTQVVIAENIIVELVSSNNPSIYGKNVAFTATVVGSATPPIGTITFRDNGVVIKSVNISGDKASYSTNKLGVGSHEITATYDLTGEFGTVFQEVQDKTKSADIAPGVKPEIEYFELKVYPNPFSERLNFEFVSPEDGAARIDIYDLTGRLIKTVFDGPVVKDFTYKPEFNPELMVSEIFVYKMILGKTVFTGKAIYKK